MKTYESDDNLNYDDLTFNDISDKGKVYGSTRDRHRKNDVEYDEQHLIDTLNKRWGVKSDLWDCDELGIKEGKNNVFNFSTSSEVSFGVGGGLLSGGIGGLYYKYDDGGNGNVKVANVSAGGEIGGGSGGVTARYSANLDLVSASSNGVRARIGIDGGSGFTAGPGGVEAKALGFGVSVGKKMGFSTPLGEVSVDTEEACVVQ